MARLIVAILCLIWVSTASAFQPRTGHWWSQAESGRGFNIDIQENVLVVTMYTYQAGGAAQWYLASGPMTNSGHNFAGTLDRYQGGQCASCGYTGRPTLMGNDGVIAINFTSETSAIVTLPGGRTTTIEPYNFGFGVPPQGLLGEWIFVYDIISGSTTFAERFNLTTVSSTGTSTGNGLVLDVSRNAACELQVSGSLAGNVMCVDLNSAGAVVNQYMFRFGLDETYSGYWVSPTTYNQYSMKGFKIESRSGNGRASTMSTGVLPERAEDLSIKLAEEGKLGASAKGAPEGEVKQVIEEMRQILRSTTY